MNRGSTMEGRGRSVEGRGGASTRGGRGTQSAVGGGQYATFEAVLRALGVPAPAREFVFFPGRKWRADFAWPDLRFAVEIDGGIWTGGRHTRGSGFVKDQEKRNGYALMGYRVMTFGPRQARDGSAALAVKQWFKAWGPTEW